MILGENCYSCWCSVCKWLSSCTTMSGYTLGWCEEDCKGENSCTTSCSQFERDKQLAEVIGE